MHGEEGVLRRNAQIFGLGGVSGSFGYAFVAMAGGDERAGR